MVTDGLSSTLLRGVGADDDSLQLAGDGLIAAVMQRVDGAAELARNSWSASGSEAGRGMMSWPTSLRLSSAADRQRCCAPCPSISRSWPASSRATRSASGAASISATGEVWSQAAIEYVLETGEEDEDSGDDPERWLAVHGEGSREGYRDMELFIASVEDPGRAERLAVAIKGSGAFRGFKDELACWPASLSGGTHSPRSASAAARDHGSRRPATACCRSTAAIPEDGPSACYQPERGTSPGRAEGRRTHARA